MRYLREFVSIPRLDQSELDALAGRMEGWCYVKEAMSRGKGAVVVSAHFGNWDLAAAVGAREYTVNAIADTFRSSRMDAVVNTFRKSLGVQVIPIEKALKRTLSALRRGEAVAFLVDKPVREDGVSVDFFGSPVRVPAGAGFFAVKTGAPIIPAFVWRNPDHSFSGKILPVIQPEATGDADRDIRATMQRIMLAVEEVVRRQPEYWYMFRRMWQGEAAVA